jgi:hypothetical protein
MNYKVLFGKKDQQEVSLDLLLARVLLLTYASEHLWRNQGQRL